MNEHRVAPPQSSSANPLGIFGGTFDPIHLGHLRLAQEALQQLGLGQVRFVPAGPPPLRPTPTASPADRLAMVWLAIADHPAFVVDDSEVRAGAPSYTVDTLVRLRQEFGPARPFVLILGADAFARLEQWQRWTEIFELAHVAVATRPGSHSKGEQVQSKPVVRSTSSPFNGEAGRGMGENIGDIGTTFGSAHHPHPDPPLEGEGVWPFHFVAPFTVYRTQSNPPVGAGATSIANSALALEISRRRGTADDIQDSPCGRIVPFTIPTLEISATAIRQCVASGQSPRYLVADALVGYIDSHRLYRPKDC